MYLCVFQVKLELRKPIAAALGYLMMKGWSFTKISPLDPHTIPFKQKMICLRKPKLPREPTIEQIYSIYEPEVLDLSKIEIKIELLVRVCGFQILLGMSLIDYRGF